MIQQGQCNVFKVNLLSGLENFAVGTPYIYKIALYNANADLGPNTVAYTTDNEITGTGYSTGGQALTISQVPTNSGSTTAYISFQNAVWNPASFTCRGALIYNSNTNAAVAVLDFGADKTAVGSFTITFPTATPTTAIIRLA